MNKTEEEAKRLYEACLSGSVETLNALLVKDQLILNRVSSAECFSSDTPLHVAASCGHLEFTKALLLRKPKLATELDSRRCTPLHLASTEGHFEIVRELLRVNPETVEYLLGIKSVKDHADDKNQSGSTALDIVEHCPNRDLKTMEIREFLLQASVHRSNCDGPKPNPELPPKSPRRTDQHCRGKTGVIFMGCISWFWTRFKVDRDWLKEQFSASRTLLASSSDEIPISSPLTPVLALGSGKPEEEKVLSKPSKVQAVLKGIKQLELEEGHHKLSLLLQSIDILEGQSPALGCMDLDLAIREDEPPKPTNESSIAVRVAYDRWERSNRLSLMLIKTHISSSIRNSIPSCDKVKDYMKAIEEQFVSSDKALASTLMNRIVEARNAKFIEDIDISGSKSQRIEWEQSPDSITAPENEEKLVVIQDNQQDILYEHENEEAPTDQQRPVNTDSSTQNPPNVNEVVEIRKSSRIKKSTISSDYLVYLMESDYDIGPKDDPISFTDAVIHSARANATHDHGLDPDRLLVAEAFVGKGLFLKRVFFHAGGRSGIMHKPECRLTVVVREITPEEEAEIAKLKVSNFLKLTKRERRLVPHKLIETTPIWNRKSKATTHG
ncbi:hypothetical protein RHSIM_Rhsim03G0061600 [Rhododendron simsii]|uniref:Ankyrin repeat family protein n=1 Tax=Rhododendron simsii TaxID=118357 RepID=A0A834LWI9_RHOSS|nr:hypothetical protein RHSIM_Rhsim03G0061600 [Rhododendron simsii]